MASYPKIQSAVAMPPIVKPVEVNSTVEWEMPSWWLLAVFFIAFIFAVLESAGRLMTAIILAVIIGRMSYLILKQRISDTPFFAMLGFITGGEIIFRDFALNALFGYLSIGYTLLLFMILLIPQMRHTLRRLRAANLIVPWIIFCLWSLISLLISVDPAKGRWFLLMYWGGLTIMVLVSAYGGSRANLNALYDGVMLGCMATLGVALYGHLILPADVLAELQGRFGAALASPVQISTIMMVGVIAALLRFMRNGGANFFIILSVLLLAMAGGLTYSRGPLLAIGIAVIPLLLLYRGVLQRTALVILALVAVFFAVNVLISSDAELFQSRFLELDSSDDRLLIWDVAGYMWQDAPVIGWGTGSFFDVFELYQWRQPVLPNNFSDAHSIFFQTLTENGMIGTFFWALTCLTFFVTALRRRSPNALAAFTFVFVVGLVANWKLMGVYTILGAAYMEMLLDSDTRAAALAALPVRPRPRNYA